MTRRIREQLGQVATSSPFSRSSCKSAGRSVRPRRLPGPWAAPPPSTPQPCPAAPHPRDEESVPAGARVAVGPGLLVVLEVLDLHLVVEHGHAAGTSDSEDCLIIMAHATIYVGCTVPQLLRGAQSRIFPSHSLLGALRHSAFCYCTGNGTIKSKRKMDHLERTANNFRQEVITQAKVCGITSESETVKRLRLAIANKDFTFKAGQWVDFFIPGVSVVGGFSICSSPGLLEREGILELAVKHSVHPPAHWIHTECTLDSEVALRVGGDFFFDPQPGDSPVNLVLIAGGVGINPLFSILLHIADLHGYQEGKGNRHKLGTAKLYYSAKNTSELLFKKNILGLMKAFPGKITCCFHVTQQRSQICKELQPHITEGRISEKDLEKHVSNDTSWYICGPPPMIESISKLLTNIGVPRNRVFFEKWW